MSPSGGSLLVDTGWPGNNGRDAQRIQAAMKDAGITMIDKVLITHFHVDHVGGVPNLVERIKVGEFLDHGENRKTPISRATTTPHTSRPSAEHHAAPSSPATPSISPASA